MRRTAMALALVGAMLSTGAMAQGQTPAGSTDRNAATQQSRDDDPVIMRVDVERLALGQRASKLVGAAIVNNKDERIGTIDDLVVNPDDKVTYAIISVGGFLGIGSKLVAVPFHALKNVTDERLMLPGATKEALKDLPEFHYAKG
jgi:sporulation protein YlmC with PRC-barrel domain